MPQLLVLRVQHPSQTFRILDSPKLALERGAPTGTQRRIYTQMTFNMRGWLFRQKPNQTKNSSELGRASRYGVVRALRAALGGADAAGEAGDDLIHTSTKHASQEN